MRKVEVDVIEPVTAGILLVIGGYYELENWPAECVEPTAPEGYAERCPVLYYRTAILHLGIDEAYRERSRIRVETPLLRRHVHDGRSTAAEPCRETALVEIKALDRICIESRIETYQVADLVNRYSVEEEKVVAAVSAVHIQA